MPPAAPAPITAPRRLGRYWHRVWRNRYVGALALFVAVWFLGAVVVRALEPVDPTAESTPTDFSTLGNALWWSIVTVLTIGYGDIAPRSGPARIAATVVMLMGVATVSIFTATIASLLTEQRLRQARGLQQLRSRGHVLICGANQHLEPILQGFVHMRVGRYREIALVNDLPDEHVQRLLVDYDGLDLKYVKGDYVQEPVLRRANATEAHAAIILATEERHGRDADERTLLATLALKHLKPEIRITAEVIDASNDRHLRIAGADEVIVSGQYNGFLLASSAMAPGIPQVVERLMSPDSGSVLMRWPIPREYVGRSFADLAAYFRREYQAILVGLIEEEQGIPIKAMLSGGTPIDEFIEQVFRAAGRDLVSESKHKARVVLNPADDHLVPPDTAAVLIGSVLPSAV